MTYHMEKNLPWLRSSIGWNSEPSKLEGRSALQFPWKLWHAVNSAKGLVSWNENGSGVVVNATQFENSVMKTYPGLVDIPTFANFRRQMREYGFDWMQCKETGDFNFSHPCFLRGRKDLLHLVLTRRRSRNSSHGERLFSTRRISTRSAFQSPSAHWGLTEKRSDPVSRTTSGQIFSQPSCLGWSGGFQPKRIGNIRLRQLNSGPQAPPARVVNWINLIPTPSPSSSSVSAPTPNNGVKVEPNWDDDESDKKKDEAWWNDCFPWILQQDPDLCRQFEIDNLTAAMNEHSQKVGGIPIHFYSEDCPTSLDSIPTFPGNDLELQMTSDGAYCPFAMGEAVIEIKPIFDDLEYSDT